jgi:hypothetical protein
MELLDELAEPPEPPLDVLALVPAEPPPESLPPEPPESLLLVVPAPPLESLPLEEVPPAPPLESLLPPAPPLESLVASV